MLLGEPEVYDSYRGELGGILGMTLVHHVLHSMCPGSQTNIIACDGLSALRSSLSGNWKKVKPSVPCFDLISII